MDETTGRKPRISRRRLTFWAMFGTVGLIMGAAYATGFVSSQNTDHADRDRDGDPRHAVGCEPRPVRRSGERAEPARHRLRRLLRHRPPDGHVRARPDVSRRSGPRPAGGRDLLRRRRAGQLDGADSRLGHDRPELHRHGLHRGPHGLLDTHHQPRDERRPGRRPRHVLGPGRREEVLHRGRPGDADTEALRSLQTRRAERSATRCSSGPRRPPRPRRRSSRSTLNRSA